VSDLAPIALFVYNRLWHTKQTVKALQNNKLASRSILYIYSDAAIDGSNNEEINEIRKYIHNINGFNKVIIIEREDNLGLADSIIDGVSNVIKKYGRIIILEDDLVTSPYFLNFMNDALVFYEKSTNIYHISGWSYPINVNGLGDMFLWNVMNCWGWATWENRWNHFEKNIENTIANFNSRDIIEFNMNGAEKFWDQVERNRKGIINTWAVFWYAHIYKNDGLCVNPSISFVQNIGRDGSGTNSPAIKPFLTKLNLKQSLKFETELCENPIATMRIRDFYISQKKHILVRILNRLSRMFINKNIVK
jgi:hypothetical protein